MWGAHKADGRIAANNAPKIRAALRQSVDAEELWRGYQETHPISTDDPAQDRTRARAWAMLHIKFDNESLFQVLKKVWADGFVLGQASANEAAAKAKKLSKAPISGIDWDSWKPGNASAALLLKPTNAFQSILDNAGITIKGLQKTGINDIGTALADSVSLGYSSKKASKLISSTIADPARALSIAITEQSRAINLATVERYTDMGLEEMEWITSDPCPICIQNGGQKVRIGQAFNSGDEEPPAHPNCRCALLPVIPDFESTPNQHGVVDTLSTAAMVPDYGLTGNYNGVSGNELADMANKAKEYSDSQGRSILDFVKPQSSSDSDLVLKGLYKQKGYDGLPNIIDKKAFNLAVNDGKTIVYRGVTAPHFADVGKLSPYVEQFKIGDYFAGSGVHGNGTYSSTNSLTAMSYAGGNPLNVMAMVLPDNLKTISIADIKRIHFNLYDDLAAALHREGISDMDYKTVVNTMNVTNDPGRLATMLGYDGITVPVSDMAAGAGVTQVQTETYYVLLNRSVLNVLH